MSVSVSWQTQKLGKLEQFREISKLKAKQYSLEKSEVPWVTLVIGICELDYGLSLTPEEIDFSVKT